MGVKLLSTFFAPSAEPQRSPHELWEKRLLSRSFDAPAPNYESFATRTKLREKAARDFPSYKVTTGGGGGDLMASGGFISPMGRVSTAFLDPFSLFDLAFSEFPFDSRVLRSSGR